MKSTRFIQFLPAALTAVLSSLLFLLIPGCSRGTDSPRVTAIGSTGLFRITQGSAVIAEGPLEQVVMSPDGRSIAWVESFWDPLPPGQINEGGESSNRYGHLWIAATDKPTVRVRWLPESRGDTFDLEPHRPDLEPQHLQWDSTGRYLYYEFHGHTCDSGVWQVEPGSDTPRLITFTRETYRLLPQPHGPDRVVCCHVVDGRWLWYVYTQEDIATDTLTLSTNQVTITNDPCAGLQ